VRSAGRRRTLERLLAGDIPDTARAHAVRPGGRARPAAVAETTLHRAARLGARIVVPSDDEWPERVDSLATLELDGAGRINRDVRPPLCIWVRGAWRWARRSTGRSRWSGRGRRPATATT
jgi:DNA processing protein